MRVPSKTLRIHYDVKENTARLETDSDNTVTREEVNAIIDCLSDLERLMGKKEEQKELYLELDSLRKRVVEIELELESKMYTYSWQGV